MEQATINRHRIVVIIIFIIIIIIAQNCSRDRTPSLQIICLPMIKSELSFKFILEIFCWKYSIKKYLSKKYSATNYSVEKYSAKNIIKSTLSRGKADQQVDSVTKLIMGSMETWYIGNMAGTFVEHVNRYIWQGDEYWKC